MKSWSLVITVLIVGFSATILGSLPKIKNKIIKKQSIVPDPATCALESLEGSGIGDVKYSVLSESDFQTVNGAEWVLLDGTAVSSLNYGAYDTAKGTITSVAVEVGQYHNDFSVIPDVRGRFLRSADLGAGVNPEVGLTLGESQSDAFQSFAISNGDRGQNPTSTAPFLNFVGTKEDNSSGGKMITNFMTDGTPGNGAPRTDIETRSKNVTVNSFVKIRRRCVDASIQEQIDTIKECRPADIIAYPTSCLDMVEITEQDKHDKTACFKTGLDEWESASSVSKYWTKTCLVQTVANAKRVLIALDTAKTAAEEVWFDHIVEEFPYYNTVQTSKQ